MSEEEIIKMLKEYSATNPFQKDMFYVSNLHEAIQGLLDLYNKEKEKNKEYEEGEVFSSKQLKYIEKIVKEKIKELETQYLIQRDLINPDFLKDYISKDKIREKIKEYQELVNDFEEYWSKDPRKFTKEKCTDYYKIEVLQELLEE